MTRTIRSRPFYARMLRLRHLAPSGFLCFVFLEGAVALGILLALAELVSWWGVLVLPITVAAMVKLNDAVAGLLARPSAADISLRHTRTVDLSGFMSTPEAAEVDPGTLHGSSESRQWAERFDPRRQWARQSANRRYE
jgi:hypothetical protein